MIYLLVFILSVVVTLLIKKLPIKDHPNERSLHAVAVPTGGGLSIVVAFYTGLTLLFFNGEVPENLFFALLCGTLLAGVSFVDDAIELSPKLRFSAQFITIILAFYCLDVFSYYPWVQSLFFLLSALWLINLFNFSDGIDGYAGSEAIYVSLAAFVLYHDRLFILIPLAVGGFLLFNWQKASIFMGDVGSTFLGFVFAVMAVYYYHDMSDLFIWFILLGLFIFDTTITLLRRALQKEKLSLAHKKHAYQRVVQSGFSHQKIVLIAMGINLIYFIPLLFLRESAYMIFLFVWYNIFLYILLKIIDRMKSFR